MHTLLVGRAFAKEGFCKASFWDGSLLQQGFQRNTVEQRGLERATLLKERALNIKGVCIEGFKQR
jgi:hypothetical protein